jgi:endonuclease YncB( thermonuclease family)
MKVRTAALALLFAVAPASAETIHGAGRAIDGDTIAVDGVHVRLKGVAAPELAHPGLHIAEEPGGPEAARFMHDLIDGKTMVCDLTGERTHGRRVGICYRGGQDIGGAVIGAGLARDCPHYSGGRYASLEPATARILPFPGYCVPR